MDKMCKTKTYKGMYPPKCENGKGCDMCWLIWGRRIQFLVDPPKLTFSQLVDTALKAAYIPAIKAQLESKSNLLHLFK